MARMAGTYAREVFVRPVFPVIAIVSVFSATVLHTSIASGEPIPIRIGTGAVELNGGSVFSGAQIDIGGTGGFKLSGSASDGSSVLTACQCFPGETVSLFGDVSALSGNVKYGGTTYDFGGGNGGDLEFEGPSFILPRAAALPAEFTFRTPFRMFKQASFSPPLFPAVAFELEGSGIATLRAIVSPLDDEPGGQQYLLQSLRYEFGPTPAPVPEPGTMLLFGSGAVAAVVKLRGGRERRSARNHAGTGECVAH
jgi:hypothetical protein